MKRKSLDFLRNQQGATAVEFAMALPIFLMFVYAMFSFSQVYWTYNTMNYAINEAGRYFMAHTSASDTDIQNKVAANLMGIRASDVQVDISLTNINGAPFKQIQASYNYQFFLMKGFFGLTPSTLVAQTLVPAS